MKSKTQQLSIRERYNLFKDLTTSLVPSDRVEGRFRYREGTSDEYFAKKYDISKQAVAYHRVREIGKLEETFVNPRDLMPRIVELEQRLARIERHLLPEMAESGEFSGLHGSARPGVTQIPINGANRPILR